MEEDKWDQIVNWLKYKEFPAHLEDREEKKAWKKKMRKYQYKQETDLLYYHSNNKVY
jgi:hypothetical protein